MSDEIRMSLPLDSDGFLRRECPTCEREFKWRPTAEGNEEPEPDAGYYCPYCAIQAPGTSYLTTAQVELARSLVVHELVGPELERWGRDLSRNQRLRGLLSIDLKVGLSEPLDPLVEQDDMRRVEFQCHPSEPVKVLDDWSAAVHCLVCGEKGTSPA